MTSLTTFNFRTNDVRTVTDEHGEPWFVAKDICDVLGYSNGPQALAKNVDDEDRKPIDLNSISGGYGNTRGNASRVSTINESGLYSLILSSKKPEAKEFKRWVTSEVLPSIRKHGGYVAKGEGAAEAFVSHYLPNLSDSIKTEIMMGLTKRVDELTAVNTQLTTENAELTPKVIVFDLVVADKVMHTLLIPRTSAAVAGGQRGRGRIKATAAEQRQIWKEVGEALLVGHKENASNQAFGKWCTEMGFDMDARVRSDAMWAG